MEDNDYRPHPAKAFLAVFLSGATLLGLMNMGRSSVDPYLARIAGGSNMGGIFLASIVAASTVGWRFPIYAKVTVIHIAGAAALGFLSYGERGFAYAFGSSLPFALTYAIPCWLMLSKDWIIGSVIFWGLVGIFLLGALQLLS